MGGLGVGLGRIDFPEGEAMAFAMVQELAVEAVALPQERSHGHGTCAISLHFVATSTQRGLTSPGRSFAMTIAQVRGNKSVAARIQRECNVKPKWRNGRRAGLKIRSTQVGVGSSPTFGSKDLRQIG